MKRRNFVKISTMAGGSLLVSTFIPSACTTVLPTGPAWEPNFFIKIAPDNLVTFICSQSEIGQGTSVGLSMIVADELGCRLEDLAIEFAPGSEEKYMNLQDTGGSNGLRLLWEPLRKAAANVRTLLINAAAMKWKLSPQECFTEAGMVRHQKSRRKIPFGDLIETASQLPAPNELAYKPKSSYQYIGKQVRSKKNLENAKGLTPYSIDHQLPGLVYAAIERCPVYDGSLVDFEDTDARNFPGVIDIFPIEATPIDPSRDYKGGVRNGVVVVAENTWAAFEAKKRLKINWDLGPKENWDEQTVLAGLDRKKEDLGQANYDPKGATSILRKANKVLEANYTGPYQVNACMEPLNAVAHFKGDQLEVWSGTQAPKLTRERIAELTGLLPANITIHNPPAGGGFGRRYFVDFIEEAVIIAQRIEGPVKVTWSREDTIRTNKYHPALREYWRAALDKDNLPIALSNHGVVSQPNGYRPYPYGLPLATHASLYKPAEQVLPRASWRSVFAFPWGMGMECFIDELAHTAGKDPLDFRIELLDKAEVVEQTFLPWTADDLYPQKLKNTLEIAAKAANYGQVEEGVFQGVSAICYNTSYCSQIVDLQKRNGKWQITKITAVMDCGMVINPSQVKAQVEGSIIWGLSAILKDKITVRSGQVQQSNFHDYQLLRMHETPPIEVILVESQDPPSGSGEPAVPGVVPAVLNALFLATGKRIREIPIDLDEL